MERKNVATALIGALSIGLSLAVFAILSIERHNPVGDVAQYTPALAEDDWISGYSYPASKIPSAGEEWYFHSRGRLQNGAKIGTLGAMTYLLNDAGAPVSLGYHTITPYEHGYKATIGATEMFLDHGGRWLSTSFKH